MNRQLVVERAVSMARTDNANHLPINFSGDVFASGEAKTERQLLDRIKGLEETLKERDLLIGMISHELRTPLATIFGNAHILLARLEHMDVDSRTRAVSDIRGEAERLNALVENMLLLARA